MEPTPDDEAHAEEILPQAPSKWYLTGFLVPYEADISQRSDNASDEGMDMGVSSDSAAALDLPFSPSAVATAQSAAAPAHKTLYEAE